MHSTQSLTGYNLNEGHRNWQLCSPSRVVVSTRFHSGDRGLKLERVIEFLASTRADILLLQEADLNVRRTHRINVAKEIAEKLEMNYLFGLEFQELTQGARRSPAYHGQVTLSGWPLSKFRIIRFQKQSNFWRPHWFLPDVSPFQERSGGRLALVSEVSIVGRKHARSVRSQAQFRDAFVHGRKRGLGSTCPMVLPLALY